MIHDNIDPMLQHFFPEQDEPIDFAKIAKATTTPLSEEARKILCTKDADFADFYRLLEASRLGLPLPASGADSSFSKSTTSTSLAKRYIETHVLESGAARHALGCAHYYQKFAGEPGVTLTERLQGLVDKALTLLSAEDGGLLEKAAKALDMHLVAFFLEKAFVGVEV